ncbi:unnamed protein product [Kuraishia capsulata CBS 1993]|uniref:UBA domain-containing protein n=1 Tax=Kuraishia capsulata CBS 1993 TaxID=1382522 RepID=W6MGD4_9ASCO|nr:uncharacterized protein KUCA_T00000818001 [Kuraishia capsulata CBS 1993]CDK24851.1 unnamed protein product [Kuraishia capsulata CBS 1993]
MWSQLCLVPFTQPPIQRSMPQFNTQDVESLEADGYERVDCIGALTHSSGDLELARQYLSHSLQPHIHPFSTGQREATTSAIDSANTFNDYSARPVIRSRVDTVSSDPSWVSDQESILNEVNSQRHMRTELSQVTGPYESDFVEDLDQQGIWDNISYEPNVFRDVRRYRKQPNQPVVLLPTSDEKPEDYLAGLFMILGGVPAFSNTLLNHDFGEYKFDSEWWTEEASQDSQGTLAVQVQKYLAALLHGDRSFISISGLTGSLTPEVSELIDDDENLDDILPATYLSLSAQFGAFENAQAIEELFKPTLLLIQNEQGETEAEGAERAGVFPIESDSFRSTLYKVFHSLLWGDDFERLGSSGISQLGDIVTVVLLDEGSSHYSRTGIEVPEQFYPQIYTESYQQHIQNEIDAQDSLKMKDHQLANASADLTSFKGARVETFLQTAVKYMRESSSKETDPNVSQAVDDISSIVKKILSDKQDIMDERSKIQSKLQDFDIFEVNKIMESMPEKPSPYLLVGTIFKQNDYSFFRKTEATEPGEWTNVRVTLEDGIDFEVSKTDFEEVQSNVYSRTKHGFDDPIVLVYVKASGMDQDISALNKGLKEFINTDDYALQRSYDNLDGSQSDVEEDSVEDDSEKQTPPRDAPFLI